MLAFKEHYNPSIEIIALVTNASDHSDTIECKEILCDVVTEADGNWHNFGEAHLTEPQKERWQAIAHAFDKVGYIHVTRELDDGTEYIETYFPVTDNCR